MTNEILSYLEMCSREKVSLQRGMNFGLGGNHSVILMSQRSNAPYEDHLEDDGSTLVNEGHDLPRSRDQPQPKSVDQPRLTPGGTLTQNGKFFEAAQAFQKGRRPPERVRVYEKLRQGIWSYNGVFHLIDAWQEVSGGRKVFRFKLVAVEGEDLATAAVAHPARRRVIPTHVKLEVWKRDHGKCTVCGATDDLHFDHIIPFSKGGTSNAAENVQLLCARHNLEKSDQIV